MYPMKMIRVIYFIPACTRQGIEMTDNQTVYLAAGALVYVDLRHGVSATLACGAGVLDGDYRYSQMVLLEECTYVFFEGHIATASTAPGLGNCSDVEYRNVVIGFTSSDGINPMGSQVMIANRSCVARTIVLP